MDLHDEITLELARLQREAYDRVRNRNASQQLGEAWIGLAVADHVDDPLQTEALDPALVRAA